MKKRLGGSDRDAPAGADGEGRKRMGTREGEKEGGREAQKEEKSV